MSSISRLLTLAALAWSACGTAAAQVGEPLVKPEHQIEAARKTMRTERRLVLAGELFLTPEESKDFWPLFNEYEADLAEIGDERVRLLADYAENYQKMTPEYAGRLLDESLAIEARFVDVRRKYVKKFRKILPAIKVARLYQIDHKLDATIQYQLAATIPLVQEAAQ